MSDFYFGRNAIFTGERIRASHVAGYPLAGVSKIPKPLFCNTSETNESKEVQ